MAKITVNTRIQNTRNNRIAVILSEDTKFKTVLVKYEDDGKEEPFSTSTIKRWWKVLEEAPVVEQPVAPVQDDNKAGDGTTYKQVMEEIIQDEKAAVAKKKGKKTPVVKDVKATKKLEDSQDVVDLVKFVEDTVIAQGGELFTPDSQPKNRAFKVGGHMYGRLLYSTKSVTVACRQAAVEGLGIEPSKVVNHTFSHLYIYENLTKEAKRDIPKLLKASYKLQEAKNASKQEKANKKTKKED